MSIRNLQHFFRARTVAVIGASDAPNTIGSTLTRNLTDGVFKGVVWPVNPRHPTIAGLRAFPNVAALPAAPDLAVVCAPPPAVPGIIGDLGTRGTKAAVVITAGLAGSKGPDGRSLAEAVLDTARAHGLRIVGPNCLGMLVPGIGLNASFAHTHAKPGKLAFVSQSGALATAILDWGNAHEIGFSCFVSIGDSLDVDLGDLLDYLGRDAGTSAILLYIESIRSARKFMSAARAAARTKPVIAVKAGRAEAGARAAASHTGALAGNDAIVDCALRRAGILRVATTQELFDAAESLARAKPRAGERLAIVTNGGGAGVMATDALISGGGVLAELSAATLSALDTALPPTWSHGNPVDIIGDAPVARYVAALEILLADTGVDALLFLHAPSAIVPSNRIAAACAPLMQASGKIALTCFLGADAVAEAREILTTHGIPTYETPEAAVGAFLQLTTFDRIQSLLLETPPTGASPHEADPAAARAVIAAALAAGRTLLTEVEAKAVLAAYGIPVVPTAVARDPEDAVARARDLGLPCALKILSPDITHKSDLGGVALHLRTEDDVRRAAAEMLVRVRAARPTAVIEGFTVEPMVTMDDAYELIVGSVEDPVFGPVLMFGHGGTAVEVLQDRVFGLPPLNVPLARDMIARTRVSRLLAGYRNRPPVAQEAIVDALLQLSQLVSEHPEVAEVDINPLLAGPRGVLALDARIAIAVARSPAAQRLAIRPYPIELVESLEFDLQRVTVRPIKPEDEALHARFLEAAAPEDIYFRFFQLVKQWSHRRLARLTQIDYDREMAFVAIRAEGRTDAEILGVARCIADPDNLSAEFAIIVRHDRQHRGLGTTLMQKLIAYCRARGTGRLVGYILGQNHAMLELAGALGFEVVSRDPSGVVEVALTL